MINWFFGMARSDTRHSLFFLKVVERCSTNMNVRQDKI